MLRYLYLFVYLSIYLSVCLIVCLFVCLSVCLYIQGGTQRDGIAIGNWDRFSGGIGIGVL